MFQPCVKYFNGSKYFVNKLSNVTGLKLPSFYENYLFFVPRDDIIVLDLALPLLNYYLCCKLNSEFANKNNNNSFGQSFVI